MHMRDETKEWRHEDPIWRDIAKPSQDTLLHVGLRSLFIFVICLWVDTGVTLATIAMADDPAFIRDLSTDGRILGLQIGMVMEKYKAHCSAWFQATNV